MEPTSSQVQQPDPAAAAVNPQSAAGANPELELLNQVFGGKFKTVEEAKRGYWELNNYASQAHQLLQRQQTANPAPAAPDDFARLRDEGMIPLDAFTNAVRKLAREEAQSIVAPFNGALQARQTVMTAVPEYIENEVAITKWLASDPQANAKVQRLQNAGPEFADLAAETAIALWRTANPPANPGNPGARTQAQLPTGQVGSGNAVAPQVGPDQLRLAIEYARNTGDKRPAYGMVFPDFEVQLPPHLADQLR